VLLKGKTKESGRWWIIHDSRLLQTKAQRATVLMKRLLLRVLVQTFSVKDPQHTCRFYTVDRLCPPLNQQDCVHTPRATLQRIKMELAAGLKFKNLKNRRVVSRIDWTFRVLVWYAYIILRMEKNPDIRR